MRQPTRASVRYRRSAFHMHRQVAVAMRGGLTLRRLGDTIHPYHTYGLGARRAAEQWYIRRHSPRAVRFFGRIMGYGGGVPSYDPDDIV